MFSALYLLLTFAIQSTLCQIHIGPIGEPVHGVVCYNCDDSSHKFPSCLTSSRYCETDQACRILYGDRGPRMSCRDIDDCENDLASPLRNCTGGGVEVDLNRCQLCCRTDACVNDFAELLKTEFPENLQLICPGRCTEDNLYPCISTNHTCIEGQFCQVTKNGPIISGSCRSTSNYGSCLASLNTNPCDVPEGQVAESNCYMDCCTTNDCLEPHFLLPETPAPATTPEPVEELTTPPVEESTTPPVEIIEPTIIIE